MKHICTCYVFGIFELLKNNQPIVLWLIEGQVLSRSELLALSELCKREPRLKIVVEMGGSRFLKWEPMRNFLNQANNF